MPRFNSFDHDLSSFVLHATRDKRAETRREIARHISALSEILRRDDANPGLDLDEELDKLERSVGCIRRDEAETQLARKYICELKALIDMAESTPNIEWAKLQRHYLVIKEQLRTSTEDARSWNRRAGKLKSANRALESNLRKLEAEKRRLCGAANDQATECRRLKAENDALKHQSAALSKDNKALSHENERLKKENRQSRLLKLPGDTPSATPEIGGSEHIDVPRGRGRTMPVKVIRRQKH